MNPRKIEIRSELSAQRIDAQVNPMLELAIQVTQQMNPSAKRIADQGCGKLRHLKQFVSNYNEILLVDTERQLTSAHKLLDFTGSIVEYIKLNKVSKQLLVQSADRFNLSKNQLDIIYNIATFDVVQHKTRKSMIMAAWKNLVNDGLYVIIVPRNDSSILKRCVPECVFEDGFLFRRNGFGTFFKNFRDQKVIITDVEKGGFKCIRDISNYRQICLIFQK